MTKESAEADHHRCGRWNTGDYVIMGLDALKGVPRSSNISAVGLISAGTCGSGNGIVEHDALIQQLAAKSRCSQQDRMGAKRRTQFLKRAVFKVQLIAWIATGLVM